MRVLQDGLRDAPEKKAAHTGELSPANDDKPDVRFVNEAQDLICGHACAMHAFLQNFIG